jgi:hypothetical protein
MLEVLLEYLGRGAGGRLKTSCNGRRTWGGARLRLGSRVRVAGPSLDGGRDPRATRSDSYLVDPASSHMLVSKIKPCMSKYKQICTVKLRMAH